MAKVLVVVDMQNDFVTGALRNEDAIAIVPNVVNEIDNAIADEKLIIYTRDTHDAPNIYMTTEEGKNLPVPHCEKGTKGWQIIPEIEGYLAAYTDNTYVVNKGTFGSTNLGDLLCRIYASKGIEEIEFIGICTDICVISNALLTKAFLPNVPLTVKADCCAGVTPESHKTALNAMAACQIKVI